MTHRVYGDKPFVAVAVHGGPGAPGTVSTLARGLASIAGTVEPFQDAMSVEGQVQELADLIAAVADPPVYLFGHSWGAWLAFLLASRRPELLRKVFLIGAGPFDESFVPQLHQRRMARLQPGEQAEFGRLPSEITRASGAERNRLLARLGALAGKADTVSVPDVPENQEASLELKADQYEAIWAEAAALRARGFLVSIAHRVTIPVRVLHGDCDPCPIEGVVAPIRTALADLKWYEISRAGHEPWKEEHGKEQFWGIVRAEMAEPD